MNYLKQFRVSFRGLSIGIHDYEWQIDKKFFEEIENSEIGDNRLVVKMKLEKQERMLILNFSISGTIRITCDRCLDEFDMPVGIEEIVFVKFGDERKEEDDNVIVVPESEFQVDTAALINDFVTLSLPIKKVHPMDDNGISGCNKEALKRLDELSVRKKVDPRWDQLKNIKLD